MIVAVVGSRNYPHLHEVRDYVRKIAEKYPDAVIVSGGARGVDQCAEQAAKECGLGVISYRPIRRVSGARMIETHVHGDRAAAICAGMGHPKNSTFATFTGAAFRRNTWIVEDADVVVAFTTGSSGTANTVEKARRAKKKLVVHEHALRAAA